MSEIQARGNECRPAFLWNVRPGHRLTIGGESVDNSQAEYKWNVEDVTYQIGSPYGSNSLSAQDEAPLTRRLSPTLGARYDRSSNSRAGGTITPRAAASLQLARASTLKLLYERAFREPSGYELEYGDEPATVRLPRCGGGLSGAAAAAGRSGEDAVAVTTARKTPLRCAAPRRPDASPPGCRK